MAVKKSKAELAKKIASKVKAKAKTKRTKTPSYVKQGQSAPQSKAWTEPSDKQEKAKPVGVRWTDDGARKAGKNPNVRPTKADVEKYSGKTFKGKLKGKEGKVDRRYIYGENRVDKSDLNRNANYKKGGATFSGRQSPNYDEALDGDKLGKPVGVRWTNDGARKLGKNPHSRPTQADIEKYGSKTFRGKLEGKEGKVDRHYIYRESREDKADMKPSRRFISLARGGKTYRPQYVPNDRIKSITLDNGRVIPNENIYDGAYVSKSLKLVDGGVMMTGGEADGNWASMYARGGGVKRISNAEASSYSENLIPFKGANLEGKLLDNGDYVVQSYGWYTIWWFCKKEGKWYGNSTKYSQSTSRQMSNSRPTWDAIMLPKNELDKKMMSHSESYEVGGVLSGLPATSLQGVGGTTFSTTDLTPNLDINAQ